MMDEIETDVEQKIHAWIYDPQQAIMKGQSKKAALFQLFCDKTESCDLYQKYNCCLRQSGQACKFGRKAVTAGPTPRARSFYKTMENWKKQNESAFKQLSKVRGTGQIQRIADHYYLPYRHMFQGVFGRGSPLESKWVARSDMTSDLLSKICSARPCSEFGGEIVDYQRETVPRFIVDLRDNYPDLFELLPADQRARIESVSHVGRKALLRTCAPGLYEFNDVLWVWDGEFLRGKSMLFQPVPGEIEIKIAPSKDAEVKITRNDQVTDQTQFVD